MTKYLLSIFVIAVLLSVLRLLGYRSGAMERLALGIICIYVIASPLGNISDMSFDDFFSIPEIEMENGADEVLEDALCEGIARAVSEEFSLKRADIAVRLFGFNREEMRAEKIEIILSNSAAVADYRAIESFINKMEIGECTVEISF